MYLCYIDESGTPDLPGNTSHYVLAGISIPISFWKSYEQEIEVIKKNYNLGDKEIHVAWILRPYLEQSRIADFDSLDYRQRKAQVECLRKAELLRLQRAKNPKQYKQTRKNYRETENYIHLSYDERRNFIKELALCVSKWGSARLFAECINKVYFDPERTTKSISEQSFEQIVSRFETFLQHVSKGSPTISGLLIHDNNETVAKKHTALMKKYHQAGTLWTDIKNIIETPLFVDSELTSMVQVADLCGYALRRYLENGEEELFDSVFQRADRKDGVVVGVRHFTKQGCTCKICSVHRKFNIS
ncbi:MAG: DUF3800 domain-containing protein [Coprothermobacterota bacterium]|nr:DUF3800 domain-containing protein [Coprothermobacterota bacterium]